MTIRTILVGASGGSASGGAVALATRLAQRFGAHLEGFHVKFDPNEIIIAASGGGLGMPMDGAWIDQMGSDADKLASETKAAFLAETAKKGLAHVEEPPAGAAASAATAGWHENTGRAAVLLPARARFFDLVVLGRSDRVIDQPASDAIERTLLDSGRPVLLAPATPPAAIGETIAVGWDGSARSVHAIAAALPLLKKAKQVLIMTVGDRPDADLPSACAHLRWHGVACEARAIEGISGVAPGEHLLSTARDEGCDVLIMGAFGHAPWREMLFGGATRTIVGHSLLPVMLMH
ncbi:MAG: universal stress protein [Proteobacteria bacterium]|nr:universal stress protein [Pseudomonadota bacterium]